MAITAGKRTPGAGWALLSFLKRSFLRSFPEVFSKVRIFFRTQAFSTWRPPEGRIVPGTLKKIKFCPVESRNVLLSYGGSRFECEQN